MNFRSLFTHLETQVPVSYSGFSSWVPLLQFMRVLRSDVHILRSVPDPRGGQKGHMPPPPPPPPPPPKRPRVIPCPRKKTKKKVIMLQYWYKCESNTCAFTECKNGRALVKYGNLRLLIRDQTTPHCDARNSKCQIEL